MPPANDAFASAQLLTGTSASTTGTTVDATRQLEYAGPNGIYSGEPLDDGYAGFYTVWYKWTAPGDYTVDLTATVLTGFAQGIHLAVYTGTSFHWYELAEQERIVSFGASPAHLAFQARSGDTYYVQVSEGAFSSTGTFQLDLTTSASQPQPSNDDVADAPVLTIDVLESGTLLWATAEAGEPLFLSSWHSVWYKFTAPRDGWYVVETTKDFSQALLSTIFDRQYDGFFDAYVNWPPTWYPSKSGHATFSTNTFFNLDLNYFEASAGVEYLIQLGGYFLTNDVVSTFTVRVTNSDSRYLSQHPWKGGWNVGRPVCSPEWSCANGLGQGAHDGNGKFYVPFGDGSDDSPRFAAWDFVNDEWTELAPYPAHSESILSQYGGNTAAYKDGKVYIFDTAEGLTGTDGVSGETTYVYDVGSDSWTYGAPIPRLDNHANDYSNNEYLWYGNAVLGNDGLIYRFGGFGSGSDYGYPSAGQPYSPIADRYDVYDPDADSWVHQGFMPHHMDYAMAVVHAETGLMLVAGDKDSVVYYDTSHGTPYTLTYYDGYYPDWFTVMIYDPVADTFEDVGTPFNDYGYAGTLHALQLEGDPEPYDGGAYEESFGADPSKGRIWIPESVSLTIDPRDPDYAMAPTTWNYYPDNVSLIVARFHFPTRTWSWFGDDEKTYQQDWFLPKNLYGAQGEGVGSSTYHPPFVADGVYPPANGATLRGMAAWLNSEFIDEPYLWCSGGSGDGYWGIRLDQGGCA